MEAFLALERTYLSWARTSLTLVGLGFALMKLEVKSKREAHILIALGLGLLLASTFFFYRDMRRTRDGVPFHYDVSRTMALTGFILAAALVALFS